MFYECSNWMQFSDNMNKDYVLLAPVYLTVYCGSFLEHQLLVNYGHTVRISLKSVSGWLH